MTSKLKQLQDSTMQTLTELVYEFMAFENKENPDIPKMADRLIAIILENNQRVIDIHTATAKERK